MRCLSATLGVVTASAALTVVGLVALPQPAPAATNCQSAGGFTNCLVATPDAATNPVGTTHTVTATVTDDCGPKPVCAFSGVSATLTVTAGPNAGTTATASFPAAAISKPATATTTLTYLSNGTPGTDTIDVCDDFVSGQCVTVSKTWLASSGPPPTCPAGQQLVSGQCATSFAGFAFALGGGPGTTDPADVAPAAASTDDATVTTDDGPPFPARNRDEASDPLIDDAAGP